MAHQDVGGLFALENKRVKVAELPGSRLGVHIASITVVLYSWLVKYLLKHLFLSVEFEKMTGIEKKHLVRGYPLALIIFSSIQLDPHKSLHPFNLLGIHLITSFNSMNQYFFNKWAFTLEYEPFKVAPQHLHLKITYLPQKLHLV